MVRPVSQLLVMGLDSKFSLIDIGDGTMTSKLGHPRGCVISPVLNM